MDEPIDDAIEQAARGVELANGYREAARRALAFARRYRAEEGAGGGDRERACVAQARTWRDAAGAARRGASPSMLPPLPALDRPGLARGAARTPVTTSERSDKTG